jgi:hypothetical protein
LRALRARQVEAGVRHTTAVRRAVQRRPDAPPETDPKPMTYCTAGRYFWTAGRKIAMTVKTLT